MLLRMIIHIYLLIKSIRLFYLSVFVDLGSFQVFGIATDSKQSELLNNSRPVLAQTIIIVNF